MTKTSSHAALDVSGRIPKAEKIRRILSPALAGRTGLRLLEIGTGSGAIANYFATCVPSVSRVAAVDVRDQRTVRGPYDFVRYDGQRLPWGDGSFDVVVSNHVVEHVGSRADQASHLREIARVLDTEGIGYLATPSRWQIVEPHFKLPGLSWIPRCMRDGYVRAAGRGQHYDCDPLSHRGIEHLMKSVGLEARNANPDALRMSLDLEPKGRVANAIFRGLVPILRANYRLSPTMVYVVSRRT